MDHADFVRSWKDGKLEVDVHRSKALTIAGSKLLPKRYQAAHLFWTWVWIFSIPAAFAVMYFFTWWIGLLMLFLLTPALSSSTKKSAQQFMIDHAIENPEFYATAVADGVIRIRTKP